MQLTGIHHLTAVTADAPRNHAFYMGTLGMRLVKKSVNQDDVSAYHLFYADGEATPGTDFTFFDWPVPRERRGSRSIARTALRVASKASLQWWVKCFDEAKVRHDGIAERDGRHVLDFEDAEGQRLTLIADETGGAGHPWAKSPVPAEHQILGLGPITLCVADLLPTDEVLRTVLNLRRVRDYTPATKNAAEVHVYEMGAGGLAAELHVTVEPGMLPARQGAGGVHHVAFRTPTVADYNAWAERLEQMGMRSSGPVDRYYFKSLYFREPGGILFEIATDGPGFAVDESMETLGERLALPPFLEGRRAEIEAGLKPL